MRQLGFLLLGAAFALAGCGAGEVSQDEMEQVREEMSQERYEEAMREAGRGDELEAARERDAARMQMEDGG